MAPWGGGWPARELVVVVTLVVGLARDSGGLETLGGLGGHEAWTLRAPASPPAGALVGDNVCTKQETFRVALKVPDQFDQRRCHHYFKLTFPQTSLGNILNLPDLGLHTESRNRCFYTKPWCNLWLQVQTQQPYQLRTYAWCWAIPPKCSRYKIQMKTVFKTEVRKLSSHLI